MLDVLNSSGGLHYHLKALRYRRKLWQPYLKAVENWLGGLKIEERDLLVIGPSGGYSLPQEFLFQFDSIEAVDPDPVASWIFRSRFSKGPPIGWHRDHFFDFDSMRKYLNQFPNHFILFANLLGQLRFIHPELLDENFHSRWKKELNLILDNRSWASFHDRLSGSLPPLIKNVGPVRSPPLSNKELVALYYRPRSSQQKKSTLLDHLTAQVLEADKSHYFSWEITPGYFHLIEAIQS